jgi:hypothetical protein
VEYTSQSSTVCNHLQSLVTYSPFGPNTFLCALFNTLSPCFTLSVTDQVSYPYKTTGGVTVLYVLIFTLLDSKQRCTTGTGKSRHRYKRGGQYSSVCIVTQYGLDGAGIQSQWRQDFPSPSKPALRPTQPPVQWVPYIKQPGCGTDHPLASSAKAVNWLELHLHLPSVLHRHVIG